MVFSNRYFLRAHVSAAPTKIVVTLIHRMWLWVWPPSQWPNRDYQISSVHPWVYHWTIQQRSVHVHAQVDVQDVYWKDACMQIQALLYYLIRVRRPSIVQHKFRPSLDVVEVRNVNSIQSVFFSTNNSYLVKKSRQLYRNLYGLIY